MFLCCVIPILNYQLVKVITRQSLFLVRNGFEHFVYSAQCSASYSEWLQHFKRGSTAGVTMTLLR